MVLAGAVLGGDVAAVVDSVDPPVVPDDAVVAVGAVVAGAVVVAGPVVSVATVPPPPTDSCSFLSEQAAAIIAPAMSTAPIRPRRRRVDVLVVPTKFPPCGRCGCSGPRIPHDTSAFVVTPVTGPGRH